jgi:hypothetical protein
MCRLPAAAAVEVEGVADVLGSYQIHRETGAAAAVVVGAVAAVVGFGMSEAKTGSLVTVRFGGLCRDCGRRY